MKPIKTDFSADDCIKLIKQNIKFKQKCDTSFFPQLMLHEGVFGSFQGNKFWMQSIKNSIFAGTRRIFKGEVTVIDGQTYITDGFKFTSMQKIVYPLCLAAFYITIFAYGAFTTGEFIKYLKTALIITPFAALIVLFNTLVTLPDEKRVVDLLRKIAKP